MKRFNISISIFLFLLGFATAQSRRPLFVERIGEKEISSVVVRSTIDQYGKIWFSTFDGLVRYDGYNITKYTPRKDDPQSISYGGVVGILADQKGRTWASFNASPMVNYWHQNRFYKDIYFAQDITVRDFGDFFETKDRRIWLSSDDGLLWFDEHSRTFRKIDQPLLHGITIRALVEDEAGNLWLGGASNKLFYYNRKTHEVQTYEVASENHDIRAIQTEGTSLWIGVRGEKGGLMRFDTKKKQIQTFSHLFSEPLRQISSLAIEREGIIWVATNGNGLYRVSIHDQKVAHFKQDLSHPNGLRVNEIYSIRVSDQQLWICSNLGGLQKINLRQFDLPTYYFDSQQFSGIQEQLAPFSALQTRDKQVWVGTYKGLFVGKIEGDDVAISKKEGINNLNIFEIQEDQNRTLWMGTNQGIQKLNMATNEIKDYHYAFDTLAKEEIISNIIVTPDRRIYGSDINGMITFDYQKNALIRIPFPINEKQESRVIFQDREQRIWVSTKEHIYRFYPETNTFELQFKGKYRAGAGHFYETSNGKIWVSSYNAGLWIIDPEKNTISPFESEFPKNFYVMGLLEDRFGKLWIGTYHNALFRYDPSSKTMTRWNVEDGALSLYNFGTFISLHDGRLLMGGIGGFQIIDPTFFTEASPPKVVLEYGNTQTFLDGGTISFENQQLPLRLKVLDYTNPSANRCFYKLDDETRPWIPCEQGFIQLNTLGGLTGSHVLWTKGVNSTGKETIAVFHLNAPIPWWQRIGVWIALFGISSIGLFAVFRWREIRLQKHAETLQHTIEEARQDERNDLASWIHDVPLSDLVSTRFFIPTIQKSITSEKGTKAIETLEEILQQTRKTLRNMCGELQIPGLEQGLKHAISTHIEVFKEINPSLEVILDLPDPEPAHRLSLPARKAFYQIYRTAMNNVVKHAEASAVKISLHYDKQIVLQIHDNGKGFSETIDFQHLRENRQFGLFLAQHQAQKVGGTFTIRNENGTLIEITVSS